MTRPAVILGAGGHAKVLIDALRLSGIPILGAVDRNPSLRGRQLSAVDILGGDEEVLQRALSEISLVNAIGSVKSTAAREEIFLKFKAKGYEFLKVIHPAATVARDAVVDEGAQILAGAVVQPGARIGVNAIVNTGACVDHDCVIGDHAHIAPRAVLSGGVQIGTGAHIGTGSVIIQAVRVGRRAVVGAGAVVIREVPEGRIVVGVPAALRE